MSDDTSQAKPEKIKYHFIKGNLFRVVHVDGGMGAITPRKHCHLAIYSERPAIPRVSAREIGDDGELGPEVFVEVLGEPDIGVVRELEVDLIMNEQTVREFRDWFDRRIKEFDDLNAAVSRESGDDSS